MNKIEAEKAKASAEAFFDAWKNEDLEAMATACQSSWYTTNVATNPIEMLKDWFADKKLLSYKIGSKTDVTKQINKSKDCKERGVKFESFWKVQIDFCYKLRDQIYTKAAMGNVVLEYGQYKINPLSLLREKESRWSIG